MEARKRGEKEAASKSTWVRDGSKRKDKKRKRLKVSEPFCFQKNKQNQVKMKT